MATEKQIAANRRNSLKSTGPRTLRGKAAIRLNNLRHGLQSTADILPGQDLKELNQIRDEYLRSCKPQTPEQRGLLEQMASAEWHLLYWQRTETELFAAALDAVPMPPMAVFDRISQRQVRYERAYQNASEQFNRLTRGKAPASRP
jgi:hypothetical protein